MKNWLEPLAIASAAILFWIWVVPALIVVVDCLREHFRGKRLRRERDREKLSGIKLQ